MRAMKSVLAAMALVFLLAPVLRAQALEWARCYDGGGEFYDSDGALGLAVDEDGFVYVTGGSRRANADPDYATIKYAPNGDTLWVRRRELGEFALGRAVLPDAEGNLYVTGAPLTLKYDPEGELLWSYDHGGELTRLAFDAEGNVVATGALFERFKTIKLNPSGDLLWEALYHSPASGLNRANDLALDSEGHVVVVGQSRGIGIEFDYDYATIKYDGATGDTLWTRRYNGPAPPQDLPSDYANAVAVDAEDNIYVSGWSDDAANRNDCLTIKYSAAGETLWQRRYPEGSTAGAACHDLLVIESPEGGALYAAAAGTGGDTLLKYDLDGNLLWTRFYAHTAIYAVRQRRLAADSEGNVYVTSINSVGRADFVVLKYTPEGERVWEFLYPGEGENTSNEASDIAVDAAGNVYLTGQNAGPECPGGGFDYLTLKIAQTPVSTEEAALPSALALGQNHPNPFRSATTIPYTLPEPSHVRLMVYDGLGREVAVLVDGPRAAGAHEAAFEAGSLPSGVYVYRIEAGAFSEAKRLILLR